MRDLQGGRLPGPKTIFPSAFKLLFKKDYSLWKLCQHYQYVYGDVVRIRIPPFPPMLQITDPDIIGKVLIATEKTAKKAKIFDRLKLFLGDGLLTNSGESWRVNRRIINPAFHPRMMASISRIVHDEVQKMGDRWEQNLGNDSVIDLTSEMTKLTFTIIGRALFTVDISEKAEQLREVIADVQDSANVLFFSPIQLPLWIPSPFNRRIRRARRLLNDITFALIAEHRAEPQKYHDLLSALLNAKDGESDRGLSDQQIRDEVITLIVAGHETTASTLAMGLEALSREPRVMDKMLEEYRQESDIGPLSYQKFAYTAQVTQEIMRLYPAIWSVGRDLTEDLNIKGYHFPKGTNMLLVQYLMHRHPRYWENPERFEPERFAPEEVARRHPFAYFPFGGGARNCIGMPLAKLEVEIVLCQLLRRFNFVPIPGFRYEPMPRITTSAKPNIRVQVLKR